MAGGALRLRTGDVDVDGRPDLVLAYNLDGAVVWASLEFVAIVVTVRFARFLDQIVKRCRCREEWKRKGGKGGRGVASARGIAKSAAAFLSVRTSFSH